jgi:ribA/ribD-fused uncharacterized protein
MSPHPVTMDGTRWHTAEHAFQALRFPSDHMIRDVIQNTKSPMGAKMMVKRVYDEMAITPGSEEDFLLMAEVVRQKATQNKLISLLLETGDEILIEDVTNRPHGRNMIWGMARIDGEWVGENRLGNIWMNLRSTFS